MIYLNLTIYSISHITHRSQGFFTAIEPMRPVRPPTKLWGRSPFSLSLFTQYRFFTHFGLIFNFK